MARYDVIKVMGNPDITFALDLHTEVFTYYLPAKGPRQGPGDLQYITIFDRGLLRQFGRVSDISISVESPLWDLYKQQMLKGRPKSTTPQRSIPP